MKYEGSCHCGSVGVVFETGLAADGLDVLECQCLFCRMHGSQAVADAGGIARFIEREPGMLHRYRFGLRTADYLLCRNCGVYVGAVVDCAGGPDRAIVNIGVLSEREAFSKPPRAAVYDGEKAEDRLERRRKTWTPVAT